MIQKRLNRGYLTTSDIARTRGWSRAYVLELFNEGKLPARLCARHQRGKHHRFIATRDLLWFCATGERPNEDSLPMEIRFKYPSAAERPKLPAPQREQVERDIADFESAETPMEWLKRVGKKCKLPEPRLEPILATRKSKPYFEENKDDDDKTRPVNVCVRDTAAEIDDKENEKQLSADQSIRDGVRELVSHLCKREKARTRWTKQPQRQKS